jgi:hypothetical protein
MLQRSTNCVLNTTDDERDTTEFAGLGMHTDDTTLL